MTLTAAPSPADPLRIAVVGSSVAMMVVPPPEDRSQAPYGGLLPALLAAEGIPARVDGVTRWFALLHELRHDFERIRDLFPDVVVLNVGYVECQPRVVPTGLVRHLTTWDGSSTAIGQWYRRRVAPPLWKTVRWWQRRAARHDRGLTYRLPPRRFQVELTYLIELLRRQRPLVLVLDIDPPGERVLHWLPGLDRRVAQYNDILAEAVAEFDDPEVRLVRASEGLGPRAAELLPDGLHRNAEGHRLTASCLAREVTSWLGDQRLLPQSGSAQGGR